MPEENRSITNQNSSQKANATPISEDKKFMVSAPQITLPKGGGAIKSIDEKFSVNAVNGTSGFSIPFPFSPSRNSFMPSLNLSYNSGGGNGIFGLGWSADVPSITRKTEKELPQYYDEEESDTFIFSGAEDLVPELVLDANNKWVRLEKDFPNVGKRYPYKPRIEGSFARIERIVETGGDVFWRVTTKDNITSIFGKSTEAKIVDPAHPEKIFKWLLEFSFDDKGNCFLYEFKKEDKDPVNNSRYEENRLNDYSHFNNTYLKRVKYCYETHFHSSTVQFGSQWKSFLNPDKFLLELVLDYGEHDQTSPTPDPKTTGGVNQKWDCRHDPFSDYRAGFEIRTYRLCKRILMFHHFTHANEYDGLVRSMDFEYEIGTAFTFLTSITRKGFIKTGTNSYSSKSLPPLSFEYQKLLWYKEVKAISEDNIVDAPIGIDDRNYQWTDLFGAGIPGILTEQNNAWYYKSNLGGGEFTRGNRIAAKPSFNGIPSGDLQFQELEANGKKFLVSQEAKGFYELTEDEEWLPFKNFEAYPNIDFKDPNLKFIDLNGDGQADILITEDDVFSWYPAEGRAGFDERRTVRKSVDEEKGPNIVFADSTQSIVIADMSGDGLADIVRIRNREIVYWPNLGYGKFGAKVKMSKSPEFDHPDNFNSKFIKLADLDGSGTTDIVYLGKDSFQIYFNQSGNSWSKKVEVGTSDLINGVNPIPFPRIDDHINVSVIDLLGNGTSSIVWSSPLPSDANRPLRYIDLFGGKKPHVMTAYKNNLGKEVFLQYLPSTHFYLDDKKNGKPWITKLPFPVQCVNQVEVIDRISRTRFVNQYKYHHGYYDYAEREFRGFGMVEQIDTDDFDVYLKTIDPDGNQTFDEKLFQKPVLTKTWFHTGAFISREKILNQFAHEYFVSASEHVLAEPDLPVGMTTQEWREALRAFKGSPLRVEIYAVDDLDPKSSIPYTTAQHTYMIQELQALKVNKHAVFLVHESEVLTYNYEQRTSDPRVAHSINIEVDQYGNMLQSCAIAYGRTDAAASAAVADPTLHLTNDDKNVQKKTLITYTKNTYTKHLTTNDDQPINTDSDYRLQVLCEAQTFELTGFSIGTDGFYKLSTIKNELVNPAIDLYERPADNTTPHKRLIEHIRTLFWKDDLSGALKLGQMGSLAIPYETYKLAFTKTLLDDLYKVSGNLILSLADLSDVAKGGYLNSKEYKAPHPVLFLSTDHDGDFWIRSGIETRDSTHFYQVTKITDPFTKATNIKYENTYHFYIETVTDAIGNIISIEKFNFRTLSPYVIKDMNDNRVAVRFDELGLVVNTFVMGKAGENKGDFLDETSVEISNNDDPTTIMEYSIDRWYTQVTDPNFNYLNYKPLPNVVRVYVREGHHFDNYVSAWQSSFSYSDGSGHEIMKKIQAEPGKAKKVLPNGTVVEVDTSLLTPQQLRWVGTGRIILNNKGKPVKQYEPYFSLTFEYEDEKELVEGGVTPIIYYDPIGRVIKTEFPDGTFSKVEFDNWMQKTYDQNDTILMSVVDTAGNTLTHTKWYMDRFGGGMGVTEKKAADRAAKHADTPTLAHFDSLGRSFLSIAHNKYKDIVTRNNVEECYRTFTKLDIEGNQREVIDALGNSVMLYKYDMLSNKVYQNSMDAGEKWMLNNVAGNLIFQWDVNSNTGGTILLNKIENVYDDLQRLHKQWLHEVNFPQPVLVGLTLYGENAILQPGEQSEDFNLNGKPWKVFDQAGLVRNDEYDFKGNLLKSCRQLTDNYAPPQVGGKDRIFTNEYPEANPDSILSPEEFPTQSKYDALNRVVKIKTRDSSSQYFLFNDAGLLNAVKADLRGALNLTEAAENPHLLLTNTNLTKFVDNIEYNEKGQRTRIESGSKTFTKYEYNEKTFRLTRIITNDITAIINFDDDSKLLQGAYQFLSYWYDPVGNITSIRDDAQTKFFNNNNLIEPVTDYKYDAIYRLVKAKGREHLGQTAGNLNNPAPYNWDDSFFTNQPHPNDGKAMGNYTERYKYDSVGNITLLKHYSTSVSKGWKRKFAYNNNDTDRTQTGVAANTPKNNQMLAIKEVVNVTDQFTTTDASNYRHDLHGNMDKMPHLPLMEWNFRDQLQATRQTLMNNGTGEKTYYVYDAGGQRVRKVTRQQGTTKKKDERIYLGCFEIYRNYKSGGIVKELERETIHVFDDKKRIALIETKTFHNNSTDTTTLNKSLFRYQFDNHLGTACLELDENAAVISYEEYYPYGSTSYQARTAINPVSKRYRYSGKEREEETGLFYYGARYYSVWLGRWLNSDPVGLNDGINLFEYVGCNPIKFKDTTGMAAENDWSDVDKVRQEVNEAGVNFEVHDTRPPLTPTNEMRTYDQARQYGNKQAASYRADSGMIDPDVQAGHTAAARHVPESGISKADWDKQKMQKLHSRKGKGLNVKVKDPKTGKVKTKTRHTSQEGLIDDSVKKVKKTQGKLTPQGQLDAAEEVRWRTQGTGYDQGEVELKRKSKLKGPVGPPVDPKTGKVKMNLGKAGSEAIEEGGKAAKVLQKLGKAGRHFAAAVPIAGMVMGQASVAHAAATGDVQGAVLDEAGNIPIAGDLLDAARGGYALGEAINEALVPESTQLTIGGAIFNTAEKLGLDPINW